jgi:cell division protein FtsA
VEEIFSLVLQEIKRSGYDGLLPAGMVLTGGSSALPGIRTLASKVLGVPVRIAQPENLVGMTDKLFSPAFSTSVGLLRWAVLMNDVTTSSPRRKRAQVSSVVREDDREAGQWDSIKNFLRRLLP